MKLKHYLSKYGVRIAVIVLLAALIVGTVTSVRNGQAGFLQNMDGALKAPLEQATGAVLDFMEGIYGYIYEYDRIVEENHSLRAENARLREQARDYNELEEENVRLRELFGWAQQRTDLELESAHIVSWDASNYVSVFTISKGSQHGLELGDCVITEYGALVGQVFELGETWANVRTVIDVDLDAGALVGEYNYAGMVTGDYALMLRGQTRLSYLTGGALIFEGDEVLTSGSGGAFPAGIWIGTISAVMTEAGGQVTYGIVDPAVDLTQLSQVFVVKSFEIVE